MAFSRLSGRCRSRQANQARRRADIVACDVRLHTALRERFRREARLIARLEHPGILPIYDFDGAHDPPYIVMRLLDGGTLRDLLTSRRLPLDHAATLIAQVAAALDYAHAQGVVHRDIKPSNIIMAQGIRTLGQAT